MRKIKLNALPMNRDNVLTAVLVLCAVTTTVLVVRRELATADAGSISRSYEKPVLVHDWRSQLQTGVRLGPESAPVQIIEFADFECPSCASFHTMFKDLRARYPTQIALSFVHYPLRGHRFAEHAARAAECAAEQGRFEAMQDRLFEGQTSFGVKPWVHFAAEAGVPHLETFESCVQAPDPVQRIEDSRQLAEELDVRGTPTVLVNGWRLPYPPTGQELDRMVQSVLAGRDPVADNAD